MSVPYGPVLVVEDIPHILEFLAITLRFKGYPVVSATNGQEGLALAEQEHPALVVTDILMPKMDGFALLQKLRTNPRLHNVPVIILSATFVTPEDRDFALRLGAARFLEKPVDTEEFLLTVAEVLTIGPPKAPPLGQLDFYKGYRERLESKLRHKNSQIGRTERLLESLPEDHKTAYQALLAESTEHRQAIESELDELYRLLEQYR